MTEKLKLQNAVSLTIYSYPFLTCKNKIKQRMQILFMENLALYFPHFQWKAKNAHQKKIKIVTQIVHPNDLISL